MSRLVLKCLARNQKAIGSVTVTVSTNRKLKYLARNNPERSFSKGMKMVKATAIFLPESIGNKLSYSNSNNLTHLAHIEERNKMVKLMSPA